MFKRPLNFTQNDLCATSDKNTNFNILKNLLLKVGISNSLCRRGHTYTNPMIRLSRTCRGRTAVWFPANSSHMSCGAGTQRTRLGRKGFFIRLFSLVTDRLLCHADEPQCWCMCAPCFNLLVTRDPSSPHMSWKNCCAVPSQQLPMCCVELALDRLLCTHLSSKGFLSRGFSLFINPTALPRWRTAIRVKQLSVAATARLIWLCTYTRYLPSRGLVYVCPLL